MPNCIVRGCPHKTGQKVEYPSVMLHGFPRSLPRIRRWLQESGQDFGDLDAFAQRVLDKKKNDVYRMCSEHFTADCYFQKGDKIKLKKGAIPSVFKPFQGQPVGRRGEDSDQASVDWILKRDSGTQTENGNRKPKRDTKFWEVKFDYLFPTPSKPPVERSSNEFPALALLKSLTSRENARKSAAVPESVGRAKAMEAEDLMNTSEEASEEREDSAGEQKLVVFESCLANQKQASKERASGELPNMKVTSPKDSRHLGSQDERLGVVAAPKETKKLDTTTERKLMVFESRLDQLFLKLCCGALCWCQAPIRRLEKKMAGLSLTVNALCTRGHVFELLSNQARAGEEGEEMENLVLSDSVFISSPTFGHEEFDKVAVYFSREEWHHLRWEEKELYQEVMLENYQTLKSLGLISVIPPVVSMIEQGLEPYVTTPLQPEEQPIQIFNITDFIPTEKQSEIPLRKSADQSRTNRLQNLQEENSGRKEDFQKFENLPQEDEEEHVNPPMKECAECGKRFLYKSQLARHQRVHTGEKPYCCIECGKCFTNNASLLKHHRSHGIDRVFSCPDCPRCFGVKTALVRHQRMHHAGSSFICSVCGGSFLNYAALERHQELHREEQLHICSVCGEYYSNPAHLLLHQ